MFPIHRPKQHPLIAARRPATTSRVLLLTSVVLNVCTLVVVANLSRVLLDALQR